MTARILCRLSRWAWLFEPAALAALFLVLAAGAEQ